MFMVKMGSGSVLDDDDVIGSIGDNSLAITDSYTLEGDEERIHRNQSEDFEAVYRFEKGVRAVVPAIFGFIAVIGLVGNLLVIVVVASSAQMRSTTNVLIINLAVADLLFIIICVPVTAVGYSITTWPFGIVLCKVYQYAIYVTAYASVYTLVLMSLDRYLAVVHPIRSMSVRTDRNAIIVALLAWVIILSFNYNVIQEHTYIEYPFHGGEVRSACMNELIFNSDRFAINDTSIEYEDVAIPRVNVNYHGRRFYAIFFTFAYVVPLSLVCLLYGLMVKRLLYGVMPGGGSAAGSKAPSGTGNNRNGSGAAPTDAGAGRGALKGSASIGMGIGGESGSGIGTGRLSQQEDSTVIGGASSCATTVPRKATGGSGGKMRTKRRATRLVIVVVIIFALCWLPLHLVLILQFFATVPELESWWVALKIACSCLAYMNSCVNPFLYAFLSENFRKSFRRALHCSIRSSASSGYASNSLFAALCCLCCRAAAKYEDGLPHAEHLLGGTKGSGGGERSGRPRGETTYAGTTTTRCELSRAVGGGGGALIDASLACSRGSLACSRLSVCGQGIGGGGGSRDQDGQTIPMTDIVTNTEKVEDSGLSNRSNFLQVPGV